ncbi:MAG: thioesterase family protein [Burkholderiaceae bacterium]|nr:thioesterase family protein [Burkholderiaceae bacterium]
MTATSQFFEPEFSASLHNLFETLIPFNKLLGLQIDAIEPTEVRGSLRMRPDLIGHFTHQRLHGGVISATLDAVAGLAIMAAIGARHMDESPQARLQRFGKLGTIDLRVDYLRPAKGELFHLRAEVMRLGSRVASCRMEFSDAQGLLLSTGAAAYMVA